MSEYKQTDISVGGKQKHTLAGVKVLDFGWALVGSLTTKQLADHGACVIRIETRTRMDNARVTRSTSGSAKNNPDDKPRFTHYNTSKYSMSLNLKHPKARKIVDMLIKWADVINENFTPGTIAKMGYGYDYVRTIKSEIIMVGSSVYGQTGPMAHQWGVDGTGQAATGYFNLTGWPDRSPVGPNGHFGDVTLPLVLAMAIVAALEYKRRTGKGQYIDGSMVEVCTHNITPSLLDWQANKHLQTRNGNRVLNASPHGVFPCLGEDRWCAITIFTNDEWHALCNAMGNPPWTNEAKFATLSSRKRNEDELEKLIARWTQQHSAEEVMINLQAVGVPAGVVQTMQDILEKDQQIKEREVFIPLKHPVIGVFGHPTPVYKLSKTKAQVRTSPCLGEHTEYVCTKLLGMSDQEFIDLLQQGVFE